MEACFFQDPACDQFSLPAGVRCNNQGANFRTMQQFFYNAILLARFRNDFQFHFFRQHRQGIHAPSLVLFSVRLRFSQLHKMSQRPCHNILPTGQIPIAALPASEHPRQLSSDRRFFRQYQCLCHRLNPHSFSIILLWKHTPSISPHTFQGCNESFSRCA